MKDTFEGLCKSNFTFPKFHLTTHYPEVIREFGSLHTVSSAHGERTHKTEVKPAHRRTSQKKRTAQSELLDVLQTKESLEQLVSHYQITGRPVNAALSGTSSSAYSSRPPSTPGSTLSGYMTNDHTFQGKSYTLRSYKANDIPSTFQFPKHNAAFAG